MTISRSTVIAAYRAILGREPESEAAIESHLAAADLEALLRELIHSEECRSHRSAKHSVKPLSWPVNIVEIDVSSDDIRRIHEHIRTTWTRLGENEPHWSVLTHPDFRSDAIGHNMDEFYETGRDAVEVLEAFLRRSGLRLRSEWTCFELGCGVGRVTAWLAPHVNRVIAADISASHLALAERALSSRGIANVEFVHLQSPTAMGELADFDVFVSLIVLQHNPPPIIARMLRTIFNRLRPGGLAYFQVPTYDLGYSFRAKSYLSQMEPARGMEMHVLPQRNVFEIAQTCNCRVIEVREDDWTGNATGISNTFLVQKLRSER